MNQLLNNNDVIFTEAGTSCRIGAYLGGGGQGEVYQATLDGDEVAVKWYFPHYLRHDGTLRQRLERAIETGPPSDRFLWPMALVASAKEESGFGYVMPLREPRFRGIAHLMSRRIEPTFRGLTRAGFELAQSFRLLHAKGFCYRDISFGNVFLDPDTGEILICDNDNVDVNGTTGGILGTPRFIAPEVVRGEAQPNTQSDLYSLATLLFYMLFIHHPLEGKKEYDIHALDLAAMTKIYGTHPVFIFDPDDTSNRPVPGEQDNALIFWEKVYPEFIRQRFTKAYTEGLRDPENGRVRESQWQGDMVRLHDAVMICHSCGHEVLYDEDELKRHRKLKPCWKCREVPELRLRLRIANLSLNRFVGSSVVMLNSDTKLYPHHVCKSRTFDYSSPVAEVIQHPTNRQLWGLKNLTNRSWHAELRGKDGLREVPPGKSIGLYRDTRIDFGEVDATVRG